MKLIEIIFFLIILNFVMTGLSALSIISGPTYIEEGSDYDVSNYDDVGATELIWRHVSRNFLASLGAGIVADILAYKLMGIPGNLIVSIGIFTGLVSHGLIGTANLLWNIHRSLTSTYQVGMGIGLYFFFGIIGILLALSIMHILTEGGIKA